MRHVTSHRPMHVSRIVFDLVYFHNQLCVVLLKMFIYRNMHFESPDKCVFDSATKSGVICAGIKQAIVA